MTKLRGLRCFIILLTVTVRLSICGQAGLLIRKMQDLDDIYKKWFQDPTRKRADCFKTAGR